MRIKVKKEWGQSLVKANLDTMPQVEAPEVIGNIARNLLNAEDEPGRAQEHFWVFGLNTRNRITAIWLVGLGGMDYCPVDPKIVFRAALLHGCTGILIVHNHPAGSVEPSIEDRTLTQRLNEGAKLLGIRLLDHIIIGNGTAEQFTFRGADLLV